jgi:hypothetical protein
VPLIVHSHELPASVAPSRDLVGRGIGLNQRDRPNRKKTVTVIGKKAKRKT